MPKVDWCSFFLMYSILMAFPPFIQVLILTCLPVCSFGNWLPPSLSQWQGHLLLALLKWWVLYLTICSNIYGAECWPTKRRHVQQLSVAEMRMLRWFCGHTRRDRVRNEVIRDRVGVAPIEEKLTQHRLRWFGHVQRRPPEAPVRNGVLELVDNVKRGRGRPKLTWDESVKRDLKN